MKPATTDHVAGNAAESKFPAAARIIPMAFAPICRFATRAKISALRAL